jgi:hypothetical protein
MKRIAIASWIAALMFNATVSQAQEIPEMPQPQKEHAWLEQLAGEWESETEIFIEEGKPPMKTEGEETSRMIGGFWLVAENKGNFMDTPFTGILTLGYDAKQKNYIGTWIDSVNDYLWTYKGAVDDDGKTLTLDTKGPCPQAGGKILNVKEVIELKDKDRKVFTSSVQLDGTWKKMVTMNYRRKK